MGISNRNTYSGYTADTSTSLIMDSGAFFKDWIYGSDTFASAVAAGKLLGATRGGGSFSAIPTLRDIAVDGVKGVAKLKANDGWAVTLTANLLEITAEAIALMLPGSTTTLGAGTVKHKKIEGTNYIVDADFTGNITFVGKVSGNSEPIIIVITNALCTSGFALNVADKAESVIPMTFTGHYDTAAVDTPPFIIYYPKVEALKPTSVTLAVGSATPVGGVTNVVQPLDGATDTTGAVTGWVTGTADTIKITIVDASPAVSTMTIGGAAVVSGADYEIPTAVAQTVVITTTEAGMRTCVRTYTISVTAAP